MEVISMHSRPQYYMQIMSDKINISATSPKNLNHHIMHNIKDLVGSKAAMGMGTDSKLTACVREYRQTFQSKYIWYFHIFNYCCVKKC